MSSMDQQHQLIEHQLEKFAELNLEGGWEVNAQRMNVECFLEGLGLFHLQFPQNETVAA